jgi:release factor glutamine methyltransferase
MFARMTIHDAQRSLLFSLYDLYEQREAANIADLIMEHITGWKKIDRVVNKQVPFSGEQRKLFDDIIAKVATGMPVQYILGEAWFLDLQLAVNPSVLIPRPETEELVDWIINELKKSGRTDHWVLDIGTGSGAIAIALKKKLPQIQVTAIDKSEKALEVARRNAQHHQTTIHFSMLDFLDETQWNSIEAADIVVSNPPYISTEEILPAVVKNFEPAEALYAPGADAMVFYRALARFAELTRMDKRKIVFAEIHEQRLTAVRQIFANSKEFESRKDMQGKDRMIRAEF